MKYYSQNKQDLFLNEVVFKQKRNGFFVDIGAHDGVTISNTYFFEKEKDWKGICIEPNPDIYKRLVENRTSLNLNVCIGNENKTVKFTKIEGYAEMLSGITANYHPKHLERISKELEIKGGTLQEIEVGMTTLQSIESLMNQAIDFISIDTEGSEFDIIKSIDFSTLSIKVIVVEDNYHDNRITSFLNQRGFILLANLAGDNVFISAQSFTIDLKIRVLLYKYQKRLQSLINILKSKRK